MTLGRLRDILNRLCEEADSTEINGEVIVKKADQHGVVLSYVTRTMRDGKLEGYTRWEICNIGWKESEAR